MCTFEQVHPPMDHTRKTELGVMLEHLKHPLAVCATDISRWIVESDSSACMVQYTGYVHYTINTKDFSYKNLSSKIGRDSIHCDTIHIHVTNTMKTLAIATYQLYQYKNLSHNTDELEVKQRETQIHWYDTTPTNTEDTIMPTC